MSGVSPDFWQRLLEQSPILAVLTVFAWRLLKMVGECNDERIKEIKELAQVANTANSAIEKSTAALRDLTSTMSAGTAAILKAVETSEDKLSRRKGPSP